VPVDREERLKKAERLLKQGKVADAIAEYVRLVEDKPSDWNSANALGDLYLKVGQIERAAEQFTRAADHLYGEGFYPRAAAVYKKVLKVGGADDHALWQLADIAGRNRLSLDARSYYSRLMQDRRAAGNEQGAVDCEIRLGLLDDASVDARRTAARALIDRREAKQAARLILSIADLSTKEERLAEAFEALKEAAQLDPHDQEIQLKLVAAEPTPAPAPALAEEVNPLELGAEVDPRVEPVEASPEVVMPEPVEVASVLDDGVIVLESSAIDPAAVLEEIAALPDPEPAEPLPLESFFEELRGKVARDQEMRAREQLERGLRHVAENRHAEAITNLEEASRSPALRFEAASQLARLYLGRGDLQVSVEWMERALEAPAPAVDDRLALMYDLADTLTSQGETSRAMAVFMELESESSGYRDVRERIAQLSQAEIGKP
jgi:tetratricopeptide (TPR) repeat protein